MPGFDDDDIFDFDTGNETAEAIILIVFGYFSALRTPRTAALNRRPQPSLPFSELRYFFETKSNVYVTAPHTPGDLFRVLLLTWWCRWIRMRRFARQRRLLLTQGSQGSYLLHQFVINS